MKCNYDICAVIITFNCGEDVYPTIESVLSKVKEVVVVDNGSDKNTIAALEKYKGRVNIIYNKSNLGIAKALNVGVQYAQERFYEWVLTLDDDSIVTDNMLQLMFKAYDSLKEEEKKKVALLAPKHMEKDGGELQLLKEDFTELTLNKVNTEITSGNLVKVSAISQINLYKEEFFIDFVDHYLCLSLKERGYDILRIEEALLLHSLGESLPKKILGKEITITNHSPVRRYYMTRNRWAMWKEFQEKFPDWVKEDRARFINETIKIVLYEDRKLEKIKMIVRGIKDYKNNSFGPLR